MLHYRLAAGGRVRLDLYDPSGRLVTTLVNGWEAAGDRRVLWNGRDARGREVPTGIYLARLRADGREHVHKVLLVD
jgi:flagellar hook assembly protein FlgD